MCLAFRNIAFYKLNYRSSIWLSMWSDASMKHNENVTNSDNEYPINDNETEPVNLNIDPNRDMYLGVYGGLGFGQVAYYVLSFNPQTHFTAISKGFEKNKKCQFLFINYSISNFCSNFRRLPSCSLRCFCTCRRSKVPGSCTTTCWPTSSGRRWRTSTQRHRAGKCETC